MSSRIEQFKQASNAIFLQVAIIYMVIALCVLLFAMLTPEVSLRFVLGSLAALLCIGWCQFALFNALHEGLHQRFGSPHREWLAFALAAYPLGFDERYRQVHLDHHKYFGDPERDPDYPNYGCFPTSRGRMLWQLFLNLCGWNTMLQFLGLRQSGATPAGGSPLRILLAQALIVAVFALTVGWVYYFWLWLVPLVTVGKFCSSTRAFCEHASVDNAPTIRTITGSFLGEKILGVFCFHFHAEHHRFVAIPYNRLRGASSALAEEVYQGDATDARYEHYDRGYWRLLWGWYRSLPN